MLSIHLKLLTLSLLVVYGFVDCQIWVIVIDGNVIGLVSST